MIDIGQRRIGSRWVNTRKEVHDGQKVNVKSRLVVRGFQDADKDGIKVQSDSPTAQKEALKMFCAVAACMEVESLRSVDITAAFLQADNLDRDIFIQPPKDCAEEGILWRLLKPLYGLTDAGRKFWLKVKKILLANGYERLQGDEAFYLKRENGKLVGMVLLHVDDFLLTGSKKFTKESTQMFDKELKVSKIQDNELRFCGVDLKLENGKISMSMEDYAKTIKEIPIRKGKRSDKITREEYLDVKRVCGQAQWLASTNRPDLAHNAMKLATVTAKSTLQDLQFVNQTVRKVRSRKNLMVFEKIGKVDDLIVHGLSDASFKHGEKAIGGQYILLGAKNSDLVLSLNWKSKMIRKVVRNAKEAETINLGMVVDLAKHAANQLTQIIWGNNTAEKIEVHA